jgi:putative transposase
MLDQVKAERGLPNVVRTDNGSKFVGRTKHTWAAKDGVELCFIRLGKSL